MESNLSSFICVGYFAIWFITSFTCSLFIWVQIRFTIFILQNDFAKSVGQASVKLQSFNETFDIFEFRIISNESLSSLCAPPLRNSVWTFLNLCMDKMVFNLAKCIGLTIRRNSFQRLGDSPSVFHSLHTLTTSNSSLLVSLTKIRLMTSAGRSRMFRTVSISLR